MAEHPRRLIGLSIVVALASCASPGGQDIGGVDPDFFTAEAPYLPRAHSHNNYDQRRPLADAIERGFASIEVDVVLEDGRLYVAHGPEDVDPGATLEALYLEPLHALVQRNGGTVYGPGRPPLQLLLDVKTDAGATYALLHDVLRRYRGMLTAWSDGVAQPRAVSVVVSGNRPVGRLDGTSPRYVSLDGRLLDDRAGASAEVMPLVSEDWEKLGPPVPEARLARARRVVEQMHAEGRKVRFWGTPEDEELWAYLVAIGVDYIGTDQVDRLDRFLRPRDGRSGSID